MSSPDGPGQRQSRWLARVGGETIEADSLPELEKFIQSGKLKPEHYVFDPSTQRWNYGRDLPALAAAFGRQATHVPDGAWIVKSGGRHQSFPDIEAVLAEIRIGRITRGTIVRHPVLDRWMRASEVLEFSDAFGSIPEVPTFEPEPEKKTNWGAIIGVAASLAVVAALAYVFFFRTPQPAKKVAAVKSPPRNAIVVVDPEPDPTATTKKQPKIYTFKYGEKSPTVNDPTSTDTTGTTGTATTTATTTAATATTPVATATAAPSTPPPSPTTTARPEPPQRQRDEAEDELRDPSDEGGYRDDSARVSGDTPVYIDRLQRDRRYHLAGCQYVTSEYTSVSLDLARQGYSPCPICKSPR